MRRIVTRSAAAAGTRDAALEDGPLGVHEKTTDVQEAPQNREASRRGRARRRRGRRRGVWRPLEPRRPADRRDNRHIRDRADSFAPEDGATEDEAAKAAAPSLE